jgi:hypothetical protein
MLQNYIRYGYTSSQTEWQVGGRPRPNPNGQVRLRLADFV